MYFSTGAGTKKLLTDDLVQYVIDKMRPLLRRGDTTAAVEFAIAAVDDLLVRREESDTYKAFVASPFNASWYSKVDWSTALFWLVVVAAFGFAMWRGAKQVRA